MVANTASIPIIAEPAVAASAARRAQGVFLGVGSALTFSMSGPLVKPLLEAGWSLSAALVFRMGLAGLVLCPVLVRVVLREHAFLRRHWAALVTFGLVPVVGCQLFFFSA